MDNDYTNYINQEVAQLNAVKLYRQQNNNKRFTKGCPNCSFGCERYGGNLVCDNCTYCGTDGPDRYGMTKNTLDHS